jgi:hypothetical protein
MSSNECSNCDKLDKIIGEQKDKMQLIETRLKDVIRAYKRVTLEKDNLLAISSSSVLPLNDSHEQQKRLSILESSVAEMSAICGKYESQRIKDKESIEELTQKCEQLAIDLELSRSLNIQNMSSIQTTDEPFEQTVRHRGIQTEETFDTNESNEHKLEVNESHDNYGIDVEIQTDFGFDFDNKNINKKSELAIVVPTQRDNTQSESDQSSNDSYSRSQSPTTSNADNYPVFASNVREMPQNSENLFPISGSHGVSLFYANELARKEIDLAESRLQAREYECALRELQWKYSTEKYKSLFLYFI